jgi:hypothetical protein
MNFFEKTELDTVYAKQLWDFLDVFPYVVSKTTRILQEIKEDMKVRIHNQDLNLFWWLKTVLISPCSCFS